MTKIKPLSFTKPRVRPESLRCRVACVEESGFLVRRGGLFLFYQEKRKEKK